MISDFLQDHTKHVDIIPAVNTDHSAIVLQLSKIEGPIRGPSYWKFNNSLLDDNNHINGMRDELSRFLNSEYSHSDPRICWEVLKFKIKTFSRNFSINKKRISKKAREQLELKLKKLSAAITTSSDNSLLKEYEDSKHTLDDLCDSITNGLIIRSKVEWYEKGEESNAYFFNLEKRNKAKTHVKNIIHENCLIEDHNVIMKNIEKFYASLYTRKSLKTEKECLKYLAEINTPVLSVCNREICDAPITLTDIFNALNSMQANKSPGNDGLTKEFYVAFFDLLGPKLLHSFKFAFNLGELSSSQKQVVITLIEKKGRDKRYLKNWRPISLLNVDTKLLSKVLACRIKVIATLVSSDQTAHVTGRFIGESVRLTSDLLEYMDYNNLPGYLVTTDIEKAFDSVDHTFLCATLRKFNFSENYIKWIQILLKGQESCVMNNGFTTKYFSLSSGTRQGDPLSAYLFILVMENLFIQIRNKKNIRGLRIFGYEVKLTSFADDVSCFFRRC